LRRGEHIDIQPNCSIGYDVLLTQQIKMGVNMGISVVHLAAIG